MFLSFDLGIKNTACVVYDPENDAYSFNLFNPSVKGNGIVDRLKVLKEFVSNHTPVKKVVIERQVKQNPQATALMNGLIGICLNYTDDIKLIHPTVKFKRLGVEYDSKNKQHKKLAVKLTMELLVDREELDAFKMFKKKDDVADAFLQLYTSDQPDE